MDLAFLQPLYERRGPWASVYVDTSRHTQDTPKERRLMAQAAARELASQGADEATCEAVRTAVDELRHSTEPHGRAFFAHDGGVVLDPSLTRPPQQELTAVWAPLPHVSPLLNLLGEDPTCLVVYVTRGGADLELRTALGSSEAGEVVGRQWPLHRTASSDWSERHFQLAVENTWGQNAAEIAREVTACREETRADLVILVGEQRDRRTVLEQLPPQVRECAVEASHGTGSRLLDEEVEGLRATHWRQRAEGDLGRFLAARGRDRQGGAGAVEGVPALVEAAREHRIDELLINLDGPDAHRQIWIGEEPDQLAVRRSDLRILGEQHSWAARADDALLRSAVASGTPAISVEPALEDDSPVVVPVGGLGALLRWA
ncbi:Vms1/Ankzf1 family peptidyl-tRNA hydrolase [Streptomyces sp. NPDC005012]|uniref:baeRF2 domain-containing protein n=1 Tax=unclassified Streptomyces TaxID=2593676 RepID=UPI0033ACC120